MSTTMAKRVVPQGRDERLFVLKTKVIAARKELCKISSTAKYSQIRFLSETINECLEEAKSYGVSESDLLK